MLNGLKDVYFVTQVQHRVPLHDDEHADRAGVLPASGLGREDCPGSHRPPRFLRFHVGHRRKNARDVRVNPPHRYRSYT